MHGQLNHACTFIPLARYALGRLNQLKLMHKDCSKFKRIYLSHAIIKDLQLWLRYLDRARAGISMNLNTVRAPSIITLSDSNLSAIGGYSVTTGTAWRLRIVSITDQFNSQLNKSADKTQASNNVLEFLAAIITVWIEVLNGHISPHACVLAFSDSGCAVGWMFKSAQEKADCLLAALARKFANIIIEYDLVLHPEHIPGQKNKVADLLTRADDFPYNDELTALILEKFTNQVPPTFHIAPVPSEITSWLTSIGLHTSEYCMERPKSQMRIPTVLGAAGAPTAAPLASEMMSTSTPFNTTSLGSSSPSHLSKLLGTPNLPLAETIRTLFAQGVAKRPLATWHRSSGLLTGKVPVMSKTTPTAVFIPPSEPY